MTNSPDLRLCPDCGRPANARHWYRSGQPRCWKRTWTRARLWRLMELIERGWSDDRIAAALGMTVAAVNLARKRNHIPSRTDTLLSARAVADRLGLGCPKAVVRWIEAGWLRGQQGQRRGPHPQWHVHPDDLMTFLENPAHWHRWHPERITEPALRTWAMERRAGVRFLTLSEAAHRACVQPATVYQWIEKGWIPAVRNGNHVVRETDLHAFLRTYSYGDGPVRRIAA